MSQRAQLQPKPSGPLPVKPVSGLMLQRKCACGGTPGPTGECAECRKNRESTLLNKALDDREPTEVPAIVHDVLHSNGQPLDTATRAFMESRLGWDFSGVRVHADARAAASAESVDARAYTVGRDVVFGAGQYSPFTHTGRQLIAHELTHVAQQGTALRGNQELRIAAPDSPFEKEAENAARFHSEMPTSSRPSLRPSTVAIMRDGNETAKEAPARATNSGSRQYGCSDYDRDLMVINWIMEKAKVTIGRWGDVYIDLSRTKLWKKPSASGELDMDIFFSPITVAEDGSEVEGPLHQVKLVVRIDREFRANGQLIDWWDGHPIIMETWQASIVSSGKGADCKTRIVDFPEPTRRPMRTPRVRPPTKGLA